ncbi:SH3 domain-containing protein [Clostridium akagii]|uniref:SH3 domain-containing protein n=1 Tax=Clostridium akagii TaxID=91623 RepID=UPI000A66439C|nr:SH3 domain-containing protein [Clostridium akagii]
MGKKGLSIIIAISILVAVLPGKSAFAGTTTTTKAPDSIYGISYEGHVQNIGWQEPVTTIGDQADITAASEAGTDGKGLRVEALKITGTNLPQGVSITYQGHVQNIGWQPAVTTNGNTAIASASEAGTDGKGLRVEALKITLNGLPGYAIEYQTHVENIGWQAPVQTVNGTAITGASEAGTDGKGLRMEALRIEIVKTASEKVAEVAAIDAITKAQTSKSDADIQAATTAVQAVKDTTENAALTAKIATAKVPASIYGISYEGHVQSIGWQKPVTTTGDQSDIIDAAEAGTDGKGLRVEALKITGTNLPQDASITYQGHVQNIGWQDPVTETGNKAIDIAPEAGTDGKGLRVEAFKITLNGLPGYAVEYQTHIENIGWQAPVQTLNGTSITGAAEAGTDGKGLRMEALRIEIVKTDAEKIAEVSAIDAVTKAQTTKLDTDIQSATTAVQAVKDTIENAKLTDLIKGIAIPIPYTTGYVNNTDFTVDLNVRSTSSTSGTILGQLYDYAKVEVLGNVTANGIVWDKINYNGGIAYVSSSYIQTYTSPPDSVVNTASKITTQFEVGDLTQIAGNSDGQGLSLGYLQWCIGQDSLQPLLNRMDREYNSELKSIFGTNYNVLHAMILDTQANQLKWAQSINDGSNNISEPWHSQLVNLYKNSDYISIENDAQIYYVKQAMLICTKYNLKTVRGFALAFDIAVLDGSGSVLGSTNAEQTITATIAQNPNISEKDLLTVISNAVATTPDDKSRKTAIINGQGVVHGIMLYLDKDFGLSDNLY